MKKTILMLSVVTLSIVMSCSKSKDEPTEETKTNCQQTETAYTYSGSNTSKTTFTYTYDANGRITKFVEKEGTDTYTTNYTYAATEIKEIFEGQTTTYKLDASNRIVSDEHFQYLYDANGYLVQRKHIGSNSIDTYSYTNGNLTKIEIGTTTYVVEYSAVEAKGSPMLTGPDIAIPYELTGVLKGYFGKASRNLIAKITSTGTYPSQSYTQTFTHSIDAVGNLIKVVITESTGIIFTLDHKFECK